MEIQRAILSEMIKFVKILDDVQIDDQLQLKLMLLAARQKEPRLIPFITIVFATAERRQPLLLGMKGDA